ncbi:glycosyltransferase [candidate division KSB3 bacterium]|uniref:Glycosyltransferase n=1 Tax=candidate division KSB3 bacterium TaxID=2044937 RepID=A0A9D5JV86_9BACT|nr:glycosyltransferase [candidate division KSB3 bacterium]MBD3324768.1 glycosyltransferase [candidate division KSB3 bacterium]
MSKREQEQLGREQFVTKDSGEIHRLSILIPLYHSEQTIEALVDRVITELRPHFDALELVLVNDGSTDNTHACALQSVARHPGIVKYIRLMRNFGEHNAVMCGLHYVTGDCVAIIDDDFQNPPAEILKLVEKSREGYDVVYSYYTEKCHSWFRNLGSRFNDWVATKLLKKPKDLYLSSFKVISAPLIRTIIDYQGPYPYIDGIILRSTTMIGRQLCRHEERATGRSNYTLVKLLRLWLNMFTGFSILPLRIASIIGIGMAGVAILLTGFFIISHQVGGIIFQQPIPPGWASIIVAVTFFAGLQLCVLGMIGEYLGRLFLTVNRSPQFIVRDVYGIKTSQEES